jgi:hypothetical protein
MSIRNLISIIIVLFTFNSYSQDKEIKEITSYPNPSIIVNWTYASYIDIPKGMEISPLSMAFDIYGMYPFIGKKSFVSLAAGLGLSAQNLKSNNFLLNSDTSVFIPIPKNLNYLQNKITTLFLDLPVEIRFRSRPKPPSKGGKVRKRNVKFAMGFKVGYNIQSYVKYDGKDYRAHNYGKDIKFKEYRIRNLQKLRYGVYGRLGYGKFSIYGYYALTNLFENNKGPEMRPFAVGLSIMI